LLIVEPETARVVVLPLGKLDQKALRLSCRQRLGIPYLNLDKPDAAIAGAQYRKIRTAIKVYCEKDIDLSIAWTFHTQGNRLTAVTTALANVPECPLSLEFH
jgi:hypothetical protein